MSSHKFDDYWAVTMFSFTNDLLDGHTSALELIDQVLTSGVTKRIEVDGPMHFRNFPLPEAKEISDLKALLAKHQAGISLIGGAADRAVSATRLVTSAEVVESVKHQLALSAYLGAFGLRMMVGGLSLEELREIAPTAEALNVKILFELHGVMSADSAIARECLQLVKDVDSSHVRLMFDSSLFMTRFPEVLRNALKQVGISNVEEMADKWANSSLEDFRGWLMPQLDQLSPRFRAFLPTLTSRVGHSKPSDYDDYIPYVESVHVKFWDLQEDMQPTTDLIKYLLDADYTGYLTSEWGGHEWVSLKQASSLETTKSHRELVERSFNLAH